MSAEPRPPFGGAAALATLPPLPGLPTWGQVCAPAVLACVGVAVDRDGAMSPAWPLATWRAYDEAVERQARLTTWLALTLGGEHPGAGRLRPSSPGVDDTAARLAALVSRIVDAPGVGVTGTLRESLADWWQQTQALRGLVRTLPELPAEQLASRRLPTSAQAMWYTFAPTLSPTRSDPALPLLERGAFVRTLLTADERPWRVLGLQLLGLETPLDAPGARPGRRGR